MYLFSHSITPYERQINLNQKIRLRERKKGKYYKNTTKGVELNTDKGSSENIKHVEPNNKCVTIDHVKSNDKVEQLCSNDEPALGKYINIKRLCSRGWFLTHQKWTHPERPGKMSRVDLKIVQQRIEQMKEILSQPSDDNMRQSMEYLTTSTTSNICAWTEYWVSQERLLDTSHGVISSLWDGDIKPLLTPQHLYSLGK